MGTLIQPSIGSRMARRRTPGHFIRALAAADMTAKLRRVLIAAKFRPPHPDQPTPAEISAIPLAWETPAA
jgi:hypothetical protein